MMHGTMNIKFNISSSNKNMAVPQIMQFGL